MVIPTEEDDRDLLASLPQEKGAFRGALVEKFAEGNEKIREELEFQLSQFQEFNPSGELRVARVSAGRMKAASADYPTVEGHFTAAQRAEDEGYVDVAKSQYEKAIAKDPRRSESYAGLARCELRVGNVDEALAQAQKALDLAPDRPGWHILHGDALYGKEDVDGAHAAYRRAQALNPKLPLPHEKIAVVLWRKKDFVGAKAEVDKCIELGGVPDPYFVQGLELDSKPGVDSTANEIGNATEHLAP
ncbi:MAG: tetratricopeptide repeat protein [Candidatus Hydrogenedentales bacterium]